MYDLSRFPLNDMTSCCANLRRCGDDALTMEAAASRVVADLYEGLRDTEGERACALVRFYKTHKFGDLPPDLWAAAAGASWLAGDVKCLTLLASAGDHPDWNSRRTSSGHKVFPLPGEHVVEQFPMVAQLVRQFGLDLAALLKPASGLLVDDEQRSYNVFHVAEARGSAHIPAQETFVVPYGIRSVLGFGGLLPSNDLFAVIMFSKTPISRAVAESFRTVALNVKIAVMHFKPGQIFEPAG
jgi:hypothetical protein